METQAWPIHILGSLGRPVRGLQRWNTFGMPSQEQPDKRSTLFWSTGEKRSQKFPKFSLGTAFPCCRCSAFYFSHQVQRRSGSHGWASRRWKRAGPPLSHCLRLLRGSAWLHLPAQGRSGQNDPAADRACEAGAGPRKPPPHEPPHQHILVPQPPCSQEDITASYQPHI